jgi:hypothetical protein
MAHATRKGKSNRVRGLPIGTKTGGELRLTVKVERSIYSYSVEGGGG